MAEITKPVVNPLLEDFAQIKTFGQNPNATAALNMAQERGNTLATDNQILMDRAALTPYAFQMKYGTEVTSAVDQTDLAADTLRRMSADTRSPTDAVIDNLSNAVVGFNSSLGNIGVLATRTVNKDLAINAAGLLGDYQDWAKGNQSQDAQNTRSVDAMRTELDKMDNAAQYQNDKASDGELIASLKSFGREGLGAVTRMIEDPAVAEAGITEGLGSVFAAGPVGKGLSMIGSALTKAAGMTIAAETAAATVPLSIGLMEGGGAYSGTVEEVMNTSHEDLLKTSLEYNNLITSGLTQDAAKRIIADKAAVTAAAIQGPIGAVTGKLVAGFEAEPLAINAIGSVARNMATEAVEETIQSATGEVAGNVGTKLFVDPNQDILEGVASAAVQGGVFGAGSAGVIQAPGTALKTASDTIGSAIKKSSDYVINRGDRVIANNETSSPVSEQNIQEAVSVAAQTAPVVAESIRTLATEAKASPEETESFIQRVTAATQITPQELTSLPPQLLETLPESTDRFVVLAQMAKTAGTESLPQQDRISAAVFLMDQLTNQKQLFEEDIPAFLDNVSHDREEYQQFEQYRNILSAIESVPSIQEAMNWAQSDNTFTQDSTDNVVDITPQVANNIVGISRHAPQNINPVLADRVLAQADTGNVQLSPEQRKVIQAASSLIKAGQTFQQEMTTNETQVDPDYVSDDSNIVSANIADKDNGSGYQYSMESHVRRINDAAQRGDPKALKERVTDLALFARHMRNKAEAHIASYEDVGRPKTYQALGAEHKWLPEAKRQPVYTNPKSVKSLALARRIHAEANAVSQLANNMATIYPELGIKPITVAPLNKAMFAPLAQIDRSAERDLGDNNTSAPITPEVVPTSEDVSQPSVPEQVVSVNTPDIARGNVDQIETPVQAVEETVLEQSPTEEVRPVSEAPSEPVRVTQEEVQADVQEEAKVSEEKALNNINEVYPELIQPETSDGTKKKNWFKQAFKLPKTPSSRMVGLSNPINDLKELLTNPSNLIDFMGDIAEYDFDKNHAQAYQSMLELGDIVRATMKKRLNTIFGQIQDGKGKTLKDLLLAGEEVNRYPRGRILNILDKTPSTFRYNPQLLETAIIAGLHWSMNNSQGVVELDRKDIAGLIGIPESEVTSQDIKDFNEGMSVDMAVQNLAETITKFWGVSPNRNVADTYTKGIPEAVAKEVIMGLEAAGLLKISQIGRSDKTFNRITTENLDQSILDNIDDATRDGAGTFLADLALVERERPSASIGKPPADIAEKQMRSPLVNNTKQQKKSIEKAQNTPYYVNQPVFNFINAIGEKGFLKLMGGREYKEGELNVNYERSLEGKNRTLVNAFRNVVRQFGDTSAYALKNNQDINDVPIYYNFNVSKVGRLQMIGLSTPQSDKLAREIFMPTRTTLDMSNPVGDDAKRFWMTVGQGLGLKTEKLTRDEVQKQAHALTLESNGKYNSIINNLTEWLNGSNSLPESIVEDIRSINPDISMHGIHSLISVAQYQIAGNVSDFTHYNYLEADGKTNGPINSLALFASGMFTGDWIKLVAKGGFFIGAKNKTLNSVTKEEAGIDLYKTIANLFSEKQNDLLKKLGNDPEVQGQYTSLLNLMNVLSDNISFDGENIVIERGATKNPLTISIYGSGKDGIASNVANELLNIIYEQLSNETNNLGQISDDFTKLISNKAVANKETGAISLTQPDDKKRTKQTRTEFTLTETQFDNFKSNVRLFFVDQMSDAIEEGVLGNVSPATSAVQRATQIQSIILTAMFNNEIIARMLDRKQNSDKYPDHREGDSLSSQEVNQIYSDLMTYAPIIETGTQSFFLSGAEKANRFAKTKVAGEDITYPGSFSRTLDDKLSTPAYLYGPTLAGVSGVPSLVIGTGDGQMIQNILAKYDITGLPVFDGFNMPASDIDKSGKLINQAVYDTWNENPLQNVANSFKEFLRNNPTETLFDMNNPLNTQMEFVLKELSKVVFEEFNPKETITPEQALDYLNLVSEQLDTVAEDVSIRQAVLKTVDLSIDQMASAEAPFTQEGNSFESNDPESIATELNKLYEIEKAKRTKTQERPAIQMESSSFVEAIQGLTIEDASGVRIASIDNLSDIIKLIKLAPIHKEMFTNTLKALKNSGFTVVFGSSDQINKYQQNTDDTNYYGKIDFNSKTIFVSNMSPETLVHELIHAATFEKTVSFYMNDKTLSKEEVDAFKRIEGLMQEWILQNYDREDIPTQEARRQAASTINGYLKKDYLPEALNEFMAWSLANQNIIEVQQKTKIKNPMFKIISETYAAIKKIIWGTKFAVSVNDNMFSNLRFNTRIILNAPSKGELLKTDLNRVALFQSASFGSSDYLSDLRERFTNTLTKFIDNGPVVSKDTRDLKAQNAILNADELADSFIANGFPMTMQAKSTFKAISAALMVEANLNASSLTRIQDVYAHAINNLKVEDFMADPTNENQRYDAQEKYNTLNGVYYTNTDEAGRSSLMSSFLALAMVDEGFRTILSKIDKPASLKDESGTFDAVLNNLGTRSMDALAVLMSGEGRNTPNVRDALDALTNNLIENVGDQRSFIEQQTSNGVDAVDNYIHNQINNLSEKVINKSNEILANTTNPIVSGGSRLVRFAAQVINEDASTVLVEGMTSFMNQQEGFTSIRELLNEIVGRTKDNKSIFDMISKVRAVVQQTRQQFREKLPEHIASKFTRPLTDNEWTDLFDGIGKTDIAALFGDYGLKGSLELITNPKKLAAEISKLEISIGNLDPNRFARLQLKAKQLANYMNTGVHGVNLLRNAYAVAHLFGEKGNQKTGGSAEAIVNQLDQLITLYALDGLYKDTKFNVANLIKNESAGVEYTLSQLVGSRKDEVAKANSDITKVNHYKGNIPSEGQLGVSLFVAADADSPRLKSLGYIRVGDYEGSSADTSKVSRGYYYSPVSGRAIYNQGVLQTVHKTVSGIDPRTGQSMELTAGTITNPDIIKKIRARISNQRNTDENLLPVYDDLGNITAYERGINANKLMMLKRNTNLSQMIGAWRGRQMEEHLATEFNNQLIDNLGDIWKDARKNKSTNEFIDLSASKDPVHIDTWKLIPKDIKDYIKATYGNDSFWVRRDMLNDAVGFRSASVGDLWTGDTRLKPVIQQNIQKAILGIFDIAGKADEAYKYMINTEKFIQNRVSDAKVLIVVKSVIVPVSNMFSNVYQLMNRGVPARDIIKGLGSKTVQLNNYIKGRDRELVLEAELLSAKATNNSVQTRKIETELTSIRDSYKRMDIYPLIEAGEFSAITDGGITQEDLALANGRWSNWAEAIANKVPDGIKTPLKYALITRDTALFQGLTRSVQYGDFLAKAILYDDLTKRKSIKSEEALGNISEEFINYNRLSGRVMNYSDSIGLTWFWKFKLRSIKTAVSMIRNNPLRTLMLTSLAPNLPVIGSLGSPVSDNFFSILNHGKLGYSIGPGMGLNSPQLNPWLQLIR